MAPPAPRQIGLLIALTLYFGNLAYVTLSVSFLQMLKASTPILVMVLMFAAGLETPSLPMVVSVLVIALGTLLAALGEVRFGLDLPWPPHVGAARSSLASLLKSVICRSASCGTAFSR